MSLNVDVNVTVDGEGNITGLTTSLGDMSDAAATANTSTASLTDTFSASTRVGATAMIALDRIQISMDAVANAENRHELALLRVNDATTRYGAGSEQAQKANLELENSTRSLEIAQEREHVRMLYGTLIVIPGMVRGLRDLMDTLDIASLKEAIFTGEIDANTAAQLANIAVATLGVGVPLALMAMTFAESQAPSNTNNFYGNMTVHAPNAGTLGSIAASTQAAAGNP